MISGNGLFVPSVQASDQIILAANQTSATLPATGSYAELATTISTNGATLYVPQIVVVQASTANLYIVGQAGFSSGTMTATGYAIAVRIA
jgi:hypothetical protein